MCQYHTPDGATAAAFYVSRDFSCFDKKRTSITNVILGSIRPIQNEAD